MRALLEGVLNEAQAGSLTARKVASCIDRDKGNVTGIVLTDSKGNIGIFDKAAVRWLSKDQFWELMHPST